ncbi:DUF4870 domain-containing protein [Vulcanisaeta thermophila]|uniref:DUF4870 domain-containing protein n=1 Tax=Vulcanisaeta thermophila TaxID=867917 RepID=UPI000853D9E9|nr:DUF4870 domain-containing protein [Vulcanisaeta thermophila]
MSSISESKIWAAIAWALLIIGAVIALLVRPRDDYVRYWALESIGFTVVVVLAYIAVLIVSFIFAFTIVIPIILKILYGLGVLLAWLIGIFKALTGDRWRPPVIHEVADYIRRALSL